MSAELRVALLASSIAGLHGIGRCTRGLLGGLGTVEDVTVLPVIGGDPASRAALDAIAAPNVLDPIVLRPDHQMALALRERHLLGAALRRHRVDVVHGLKHHVPRTRCATVLTVHDVLTLTWPQQFDLGKRLLLPREYRASLDAATRLVAVSETTRNRLRAIEPRWAEKAVVVPNGQTSELAAVAPAPVAALNGPPFAVVVGDLSPRKNVGFLLDLWSEVHARTGARLAVVGTAGWRSDATREQLEALERAGLAVWVRDASDAQLRWCYEHAVVALVPTLEEGYGIPVAEALTLDVPVLASTDPAVVEVARGRARHLDVGDRGAWLGAVVDSFEHPAAHRPQDLGGLSWAENAAATVAVYREARDLVARLR